MSINRPHHYPGAPGHDPDDPGECFTSNCSHGCGCWAGPSSSGGPDGIDPWGECPKAPLIHPCDTLGYNKILGHDGDCTPDPAIALKEGDTFKVCGKTLVGRGTDTYDPLCVREEGHEGACWEARSDGPFWT